MAANYQLYGSSPESHRVYRTDGSERIVSGVISKLMFIAQIKEGDIIDVASYTLMEPSMKTSAYRTFIARAEGRDSALEMFITTTDSAFNLLEKYLLSSDTFFRSVGLKIAESIQNSKRGMTSHMVTYSKDAMYVAKVKTLIDTLGLRMDDILARFRQVAETRTLL